MLQERHATRSARGRLPVKPRPMRLPKPKWTSAQSLAGALRLRRTVREMRDKELEAQGATGIGRAVAEAFVAGGSEVIICGRREDRLKEAQSRVPSLHINAIINVSSGLGFVSAAKMPVYSASKAAVHAFTMALRHQLSRVGTKVFEVVPPAVDTELNPEGRARRGGFKPSLSPETFVAAAMNGLASDTFEIGFGMTEAMLKASRADLDTAFVQMNGRM